MASKPKPHDSHEWAEDKAQTRCVKCGAYRHLSSGFEPCGSLTAVAETREPATPAGMVAAAIEKGMDAAQLTALTAWANGMAETEARRVFNADMVACQSAMPSIVNDAQNPSTSSKYPKFETLLRTAKPVWTQHGFSLSFGTEDAKAEGMVRVVCDVRHRGGHVERYRVEIGLDGIGPQGNPIGKMNRPQASGSTLAYGQRYLTKLIFCLAFADEDDDAVQARTTRITPEQVGEVNDLIKQCEAAGNPVNFPGFLAWLKLDNLGDMMQADLPKAKKELQRKLRGGQQ